MKIYCLLSLHIIHLIKLENICEKFHILNLYRVQDYKIFLYPPFILYSCEKFCYKYYLHCLFLLQIKVSTVYREDQLIWSDGLHFLLLLLLLLLLTLFL